MEPQFKAALGCSVTLDPQTAITNLIDEFDPKRGITLGTLIAEAQNNGWTPASPFDPVLIVESPVTMELHTPIRGYKIYSREDLRRLPKQQWLIHGVLPLQGTAAIFGAPGTGKSFLALDLAARISEGIDSWFDIGTKQRDVVYMALEGGGYVGRVRRGSRASEAGWSVTLFASTLPPPTPPHYSSYPPHPTPR